MRPIPKELRYFLSMQPRMKICAIAYMGDCSGRIEWDHVWIYSGRQINEPWAIVGICHAHHMAKEGNKWVKAAIQMASLTFATKEDLDIYPRKDWSQARSYAESLSTPELFTTPLTQDRIKK